MLELYCFLFCFASFLSTRKHSVPDDTIAFLHGHWLRTLLLNCDKYMWALDLIFYLFCKYLWFMCIHRESTLHRNEEEKTLSKPCCLRGTAGPPPQYKWDERVGKNRFSGESSLMPLASHSSGLGSYQPLPPQNGNSVNFCGLPQPEMFFFLPNSFILGLQNTFSENSLRI